MSDLPIKIEDLIKEWKEIVKQLDKIGKNASLDLKLKKQRIENFLSFFED